MFLLGACSSPGQPPAASAPTAPTEIPEAPSPAATATPSRATPSQTPAATAPPATGTQATAEPTVAPHSPAAPAWRERSDVAAGPSAREDHTWTVDGDGQRAYLFGGRGADGASAELWAFDLATDGWALLTPSGATPAARFGHTATWVPDVGLVIWSGQRGSEFFADIWTYDPVANAWRELPSLGAVPPARYGSCASLGPDGRLWISHGFTADTGRFADTRAYDFITGEWTDMTPSGDVPVERCLHDCYWSTDGRLILYAGQTTGVAALGDIWTYDPGAAAWTRGPEPGAPPRQLYALATASEAALVFGGGTLDGAFLDDTWQIDPTSLTLQPIVLEGDVPPGRSGATLIHDAARGRTLLFGGQSASGPLDDLWELAAAD